MSERRGRSGGREARRAARAHSQDPRLAYVTRGIPVFEVLGEEGLVLMERNADTILQEIGIEFHFDDALQRWRDAGADVQGTRVRFPRGMCREIIQRHAPREFVQHARNPEHNVHIGGDKVVFAPAYGSPFIRNLEEGRRYATIEDFRNFAKLTHLSPALHHGGGTLCEPVDLPVPKRHLEMVYSHIRYHDKAFMGSVTAPERAQDSVEMTRILFGAEFVDQHPCVMALINANSPLTFDATMLGAAKVYAENNQIVLIAPFVLAGAMAPVTVAGCVAQMLAEALAGMAYVQLVRPGAPVIFGNFSSSISMQSGAPTFGTPEPVLILYCITALARRLGVPVRGGGALCASKVPDAQAAYESANTLQASLLAGVNFLLHTAGWLEGGLAMGYEKFILDADQANMAQTFLAGVDLSENGQAMEAIREVGPGQHFLGCAHTQANFETAFCTSKLADNNSFEQWQSEGALEAPQRAQAACRRMLRDYQPPPLDAAADEALRDYVRRRMAELPDTQT